MLTKIQRELYEVITWPEYMTGTEIRNALIKRKRILSYGFIHINMRKLVESGFAEFIDSEDEDGLLRLYRKKHDGSRPEKEGSRDLHSLDDLAIEGA